MAARWTVLTRADLRGFDDMARDLVLAAMRRGGTGRVSSGGHAILRAPDGRGTVSVAPKLASAHRARQNTLSQWTNVFGHLPELETRTNGSLALAPAPDPHPLVPKEGQVMYPCPVESCDKEFVTEGARYQHVERDHYKCPEPGCGKVFTTGRGRQGHINLAHGKPRPCPHDGCDFVGSPSQLGPHNLSAHPQLKPELLVKARFEVQPPNQPSNAEELVKAIRRLLGDEPRIAELEAALAEATARAEKAESKLAKLREAMG